MSLITLNHTKVNDTIPRTGGYSTNILLPLRNRGCPSTICSEGHLEWALIKANNIFKWWERSMPWTGGSKRLTAWFSFRSLTRKSFNWSHRIYGKGTHLLACVCACGFSYFLVKKRQFCIWKVVCNRGLLADPNLGRLLVFTPSWFSRATLGVCQLCFCS